ncbi:MAG: CoB--CoM heterodisulfide reductase iron-sulfur subunit B family protein [Nitrospirae bacterium]|nr:CoB--CoM heterodisulfide reductase iron-sulfur subunit B family protein [Nitrospirota bacterium]
MEIIYYPGCTLDASSKLYDVQTRIVMEKMGFSLRELEDWSCCGATSASKTDEFLAVALPARNLGIADATGLGEIVIPCSSCYSRMLVSQKILAKNAALKDRINSELTKKVQGSIKILNILELLATKSREGFFAEKLSKKLEGLKPACYYGCLQTRFPIDMEVPYDVENPQGMEDVCVALGAAPVDWSYKTDCCGASASVNDSELSFRLMSKIIQDAAARGANCFVTTCPMCQLNLDAYQNQIIQKYGLPGPLPVYFLTEFIGIAMGVSPYDLQIDRHFVESISLLKELNLI